ncbi:MAG: hypothetical protein HZC01_01215 [Candidatus Kerfeldbacteria bacterium]|nr:hypothetical protein [Candidatus Kerfeldbacteria bacterium]
MMSRSHYITIRILFIAALVGSIGLAGLLGWYHILVKDQQHSAVNPESIFDQSGFEYVSYKSDPVLHEDGTASVMFSPEPVQYLTPNPGEYAPIDTALVPAAQPEYAFENTTNIQKAYFKNDVSSSNFIVYQSPDGKRRIETTYRGAQDSVWTAIGDQVTYADIYPGIDARYSVGKGKLIEELIVDSATTAATLPSLTQQLVLTGLYPKLEPDGSITFHDTTTKHVVFISPAPVMYELAETDPGASYDIAYRITQIDERVYEISKVISPSGEDWLAHARYPLVIDNSYFGTQAFGLYGQLQDSYAYPSSPVVHTYTFNGTPTGAYWLTGTRAQGPPQSCSSCPDTRWEYRQILSFYTGDANQPGGSGFDDAQVQGARLYLNMYRTGGVAGEQTFTEGNNVTVYSGADKWTSVSNPSALWALTSSMTNEGLINTTGLPTSATQNCVAAPANCTRIIDVELSSLGLVGALALTQFQLDIPSEIFYGPNWGVRTGTEVQTTPLTQPYAWLEIVYFPRPVISRVDPQSDSSISTLEIDIDDDFDDETNFRLERSLTSSTGPWTEICTTLTTGGSGTCTTGVTYNCTTTSKAGTTGICTITDNLQTSTSLTQYSDKHVWYRARVQRLEAPGSYISNYSNVQDDYTYAAKAIHPPSVTSETWSSIKIWPAAGVGDEYTNQRSYFASDPEPTRYCIGLITFAFSPSWNYSPTADIRYVDDPPSANSTVYTNFPDGVIGTRDWVANGSSGGQARCLTFNQWINIPLLTPFYASGEYSAFAYLKPNAYYAAGTFSQNTRNNTVNDPDITNYVDIYTRARTPSAPSNPASANNTSTSFQIALNTTPQNAPTTSPWLNPSSTQYAMQIFQGGSWQYFSSAGGSTRFGTAQWATDTTWGGATGITLTGLSAATCYDFRAQSKNSTGVIGESASSVWSNTAQYCTPLNTPATPDVVCNYNTTDGYYCDVTIRDTVNPSPPYFYKVQRSYDGASAWTDVQGYIPGGALGTYNAQNWSQTFQNGQTVRFKNLSCTNATNTRLYFRVYASMTGNNASTTNSAASAVKDDTLPPCAPSAPVLCSILVCNPNKGHNYIKWDWTAPYTRDTEGLYQVDFQSSILYPNITPAGNDPWTQSNLSPNQQYTVTVRGCDNGNASNGNVERCGQWSGSGGPVRTYAAQPNVTVACNHVDGVDDDTDDYYCAVTITEQSPENPSDTTSYRVSYCTRPFADDCEGGTWTALPWETKRWIGSTVKTFNDNIINSWVACSLSHTYQYYKVEVRNSSSEVTPLLLFIPPSDTLPPCEITYQTPNHDSQTTNSLRWLWNAPVGGAPVVDYTGTYNQYCRSTPLAFNTAGTNYIHSSNDGNAGTSDANQRCTISVRARDSRGRLGRSNPLTGSIGAYTSIETVGSISFTDVQTNQISVMANSSGSTFNNLTTPNSGISFENNPSAPGGGGEAGFSNHTTQYITSNSVTDSGLSANRNYCYQARSANADRLVNGTGDINSFVPGAGVTCRYTLAAIPAAPILVRAESGTSANVTVRTTDGNPQGGAGIPETQYALCVTKYDSNGNVEYERYARTDGSIDMSGGNFQCASGDSSGIWATYSQWGSNNGIDVALDPSSKYDFAMKARNGDGPTIVASGCVAGNTCIETSFGPKATLFLVRNNIVGWAWSSNLGWISTNCLNLYNLTGFGFSCGTSEDWGVNTMFEETRDVNPVTGYAWSSSGRSIPEEQWSTVETVNTNKPAQTNSANSSDKNIVIDAFGRVHRVWAEAWPSAGNTKDIFYQRWNGREWVTAAGALGADNISQTSLDSMQPTLVFDENANPHIAWAEKVAGISDYYHIWYLRWNPEAQNGFGAWVAPTGTVYRPGTTNATNEKIDVSTNVITGNLDDLYPSIAIDALNQAHIAFKKSKVGGTYDVYYTEWGGADWVRPNGGPDFDDIANTTSTDHQPSLAVDPTTGYPYVVWGDAANQVLYRYWNGSAWSAEVAVNGATTGVKSPKIVLDRNVTPHIAWATTSGARYITWNGSAWAAADGTVPADTSATYNPGVGGNVSAIDLKVDRQRHPHVMGYESGNPQIIRYRNYDPAANSGAGAWITTSGAYGGGNNDANLEAARRTGFDIRGLAFDIDGEGDPYLLWSESDGLTPNDWNVHYRFWDAGYGEAGVGWITFNTNVCANNTQQACADSFDCKGATCVESAGTPPQTTDWAASWNDVKQPRPGFLHKFAYDSVTAGGPYYWITLGTDWSNSPANADHGVLKVRVSDMTTVGYVDLKAIGGLRPLDAAFDGTAVWVTAYGTNQVYRINPTTLAVEATINLVSCADAHDTDPQCNPEGIDYDPTSGDIYVINQEAGGGGAGGNWWGSISRIDPATNTEVHCDTGLPAGGAPRRCGRCSNSAYATEAACIAVAGTHWGTGRRPVDANIDVTTHSLWTGHVYETSIARLDLNTGTIQSIPLPSGYAFAYYDVVRVNASLYVPLTASSSHPRGQFGIGAVMIIDPVAGSIIDTIEFDHPQYPQGIAYDGRYLWMTAHTGLGNCNNDATILCSAQGSEGTCAIGGAVCDFDYQCSGAGNYCQRAACSSVGGGCSNSQARIFQYEASTMTLVNSYKVSSRDYVMGSQIMYRNNAIWTVTTSGLLSGGGNLVKVAQATSSGHGYGYCYDQAGSSGQRYGVCSDGIGACVADTDCLAGESCVFETCATQSDCPDYAPTGADEQCKAIATASFSGITREVTGWARIMSLKSEGEALGYDDWGWIRLGGTYDDGATRSGRYTLSGTEIDSQQFLGDPDVNPTDVSLYTLFGWGWQASLIPQTHNNSVWLPHVRVTASGRAASDQGDNYGSPSLVVDSIGDPHMAWSEYNSTNNSYQIYYARLKAGEWETANGTAYVPGTTDPQSSRLNVSNINGVDAFWPSLQLSGDRPYIVWQQGGTYDQNGEVFFSYYDDAGGNWTTPEKIDNGGMPDLALDAGSNPHVVYRFGNGNTAEVYYRWKSGGVWIDPDGGVDDIQVSNSLAGSIPEWFPKLTVTQSTPAIPHIVWVNGAQINYRTWNGVNWVTASGQTNTTNLQVNAGVDALDEIVTINGQDPDIALTSAGRPGIVWRDPQFVLYRTWNGTNWVTVSGSTAMTNILVNGVVTGETQRHAQMGGAPTLAIDADDQPHITWADDTEPPAVPDVRYRYWDQESNGGQGAWVTATGDYGIEGGMQNYDDPQLTAGVTADSSTSPSLALDRNANPHIAWNELHYSATACNPANGDADCGGEDPVCLEVSTAPGTYRCASSNVLYTKLSGGAILSGVGWIEFIPASALLGIPYIRTSFGDVYSGENVTLAPPPAGSSQYTATYLIQANGDIQGIPGNYASSQTGLPTSQLQEPGLNPLVTGAGLPFGEKVLSRLDIDSLITDVGGAKNRFGHDLNVLTAGDLANGSRLGTAPVLNGEVYYVNGNAVINSAMTITKGAGGTTGNGLIVIDGDLEINAAITYDNTALTDLSEMPSAAFIVRGNITVNSLVDTLAGVYVAIDRDPDDGVASGIISTGRKNPVAYTVAVSPDDTTVLSTGANTPTSTTASFGVNASGQAIRTFLRYQMPDVPAGAEIRRAYLRFDSTGLTSGGDFTGRIYLMDSNNVGGVNFTNTPNLPLFDSVVSNSVTYDTTAWNTVDSHDSPDITSLVKRFLNDEAYAPTNYIGLVLHEGQATTNQFKTFASQDHLSLAAPVLVIEYAPQRTIYTLADVAADPFDDDAAAWGTGGSWSSNSPCQSVGWYLNNPNRVYLRFAPQSGFTQVPDNAQIVESHLRVQGNDCNSSSAPFELRQGLLEADDMPVIGANPFEYAMTQDVSEVAEDVAAGAWGTGSVHWLTDSTSLIQSWIDRAGYTVGNHIGIRLRRGGNETFAALNETRPINPATSQLHIDYQTPLYVSGLFIASGYNFDRTYTKNLEGAEQIVYDGRVVANTPPGLADFTRALPLYQRVVP